MLYDPLLCGVIIMQKTAKRLHQLKEAKDYKKLEEESFEYHFNEHRGGSFSEMVATKVFAFGEYWEMEFRWISRGWGDYVYEYFIV